MKALFGFCYANEDTLDAASEITHPRADFAAIISHAIDNERLLAKNLEMRLELDRSPIGEGPGLLAMLEELNASA